jgi:hypothetical protein
VNWCGSCGGNPWLAWLAAICADIDLGLRSGAVFLFCCCGNFSFGSLRESLLVW